jgi:hypothetical protein
MTLVNATLSCIKDISPFHFSYDMASAITRFTLSDRIATMLNIKENTSASSTTFLVMLYVITVSKWLIYAMTGYKYDNISWIRNNLLRGLKKCNVEYPKWRLLISRKKL